MTAKFTGPPVRLQLRRMAGFNLQLLSEATNGRAAVNCARPGWAGNSFHTNDDGTPMTAERAYIHHRAQLVGQGWVLSPNGKLVVRPALVREKLRGRNLACFCKVDAPCCHVITLLEVANGD